MTGIVLCIKIPTFFLYSLIIILCFFSFTKETHAYSSIAGASTYIGQINITSNGSNSTKQGFNGPTGLTSDGVHLAISDSSNNRIMIYNSIPIASNPTPDVVIGQGDFTSNVANQGGSVAGNTLDYPSQMDFAEGKLLVTDSGNNRILIFSHVPQKNNVSADIVIGQPDMVSNSATVSATQLSQPNSVAYDIQSGKLAIADTGNNRVLLYNKVPTANNQAADIVLGQTSFTSKGADVRQDALSSPYGVRFMNGKLVVADSGNNRVLIWNSIPSTNGQPADVVIGQPNFTTDIANQGASVGTNTLSFPMDTAFDGTRFIIDDNGNNRLLIFNSLPFSNNPTADQVLGQINFTSASVNGGGSTSATSLNNPSGGLISVGRNLFVCDTSNNRVLFFYNYSSTVSMTLTNTPVGQPGGLLRMYGNITLTYYYKVQGVQFQVNSGNWQAATAVDGTFDETKEDFYVTYDPNSNKTGDGYTLRVNATNTNNDVLDNLFYFEPFKINGPDDRYSTSNFYPTFDFSVNKQLQVLSNNLSNYQIWIKRPKSTTWTLYASGIPIDFNLVRLNAENIKRGDYPNPTHNGMYETTSMAVTYSEDSSRISIHNKTGFWITGTYQWKVVAVDKAGHTQDSDQRIINNSVKLKLYNPIPFPLEIDSISGVGSVNLNSTYPWKANSFLSTSVQNPIIYGLAPTNALIALNITDLQCLKKNQQNCTQEFTTIANTDSQFGINIPNQVLKKGQDYTFSLSSYLWNNYNELPAFTLKIIAPINLKVASLRPDFSQGGRVVQGSTSINFLERIQIPKKKNIQKSHQFCIFKICF